jgi:hypothetical protein
MNARKTNQQDKRLTATRSLQGVPHIPIDESHPWLWSQAKRRLSCTRPSANWYATNDAKNAGQGLCSMTRTVLDTWLVSWHFFADTLYVRASDLKQALITPSVAGTSRWSETRRAEWANRRYAVRNSHAKWVSVARRVRFTHIIPEVRPSGRTSKLPVRSRQTGAYPSTAYGSAQRKCEVIGSSEHLCVNPSCLPRCEASPSFLKQRSWIVFGLL